MNKLTILQEHLANDLVTFESSKLTEEEMIVIEQVYQKVHDIIHVIKTEGTDK